LKMKKKGRQVKKQKNDILTQKVDN